MCSISAGSYYLQENDFSWWHGNVDLHMYYTVNMAVGTQIPEIEKMNGHMQIESAELYGKDLTEPGDHFTVTDTLLSENPVILNVKDLQVELYEDEEILIEYTLAHAIPFKDDVECVVNNEKVYLTKKDLALSNRKIENWFTQQNKWLAVVLIAHFIGVVGMIMVKKWFTIRSNVTTIDTSIHKVAKQLAGAISLPYMIG